jgi:nitrate/TMAO reductase-like tetraheme cytochrome c subunit
MSKKWAWIGGAVVGLAVAYGAAVIVDITGQDKFCVSCHKCLTKINVIL